MDKLQQLEDQRKEVIEIALTALANDGDHHKIWSIDQMLQILAGGEYSDIVKEFEKETGRTWDKGIEA